MDTNTDTIPLPQPVAEARSGFGRALGIAGAGIAVFLGVLVMVVGAGVVGVQAFAGNDDGYVSIEEERLTSNGHAVATDEIDLSGEIAGFGIDDLGATVRLEADASSGEPVFVGIARRADAERYLGGVEGTTLLGLRGDRPHYAQHGGSRPATRHGDRPFWVASSEGTGVQTLDWEPREGHWMAVVANADASRGVDAEVEASAHASWLIWAGLGALVAGAGLAGLGGFAIARLRRDP